MICIKLQIDIDEFMIKRIDVLAEIKSMSRQELLEFFIKRELVIEEELQMSKIMKDVPQEVLLENFDV